MKKFFKIDRPTVISVSLVALIMVLGYFGRMEKNARLCKGMIIELKEMRDQDENLFAEEDIRTQIIDLFGLDFTGTKMELLELREIENSLNSFPHIENAEAFIDAESNLRISVEQRIPILRYLGNDEGYYLDIDANRLPLSNHLRARLPVVTGKFGRDSIVTGEIIEIASFINKSSFWKPMIEQIHVNDIDEFELIPKLGHQRILFGRAERLEEKFEYLKSEFYEKIVKVNGYRKYNSIDIRYKSMIFCKTEGEKP